MEFSHTLYNPLQRFYPGGKDDYKMEGMHWENNRPEPSALV
jgi:hypothetical protein